MAGPPHETRCSAVSAGLGEPLAGNAFTDSLLLCVEHLGPWPRSVDRHPDPALAALVARARTAGRRTRLIRRPGRRPGPDSGRTLLLADTAPGRMRVGALRVRGPGELADVPLDHAGAGAPVDAPMLLVCTHGTRDLCCAVEARSPRPSWPRSPRTGPPASGGAAISAGTGSRRPRWSCPPATSTAGSTWPPPSPAEGRRAGRGRDRALPRPHRVGAGRAGRGAADPRGRGPAGRARPRRPTRGDRGPGARVASGG
jgi:hypothetical protein